MHALSPLLRAWCVAALFALSSLPAVAGPEHLEVAQARELVDTYYGDTSILRRAAALLQKAYEQDPGESEIYVQAARITVMGGHLSFGRLANGTLESYESLLDRALALDPKNAKAHILKAEAFNIAGRHYEELLELDAAKALGTTDPWLLMGYGRYYIATNEALRGYQFYIDVKERGPGSTASERRAFVQAVTRLRRLKIGDRSQAELQTELAALAMKERYPTDAWTPLTWAEEFFERERFDDAIFYARAALRTMKFPAASRVLSAALYVKAALLTHQGVPETAPEVQALIEEARGTGVEPERILAYFVEYRDHRSTIPRYRALVEKFVR